MYIGVQLCKDTLTSDSSIINVKRVDIVAVTPIPMFISSTGRSWAVHESTFSAIADNFMNLPFTSTEMGITEVYCTCLKELE